MDAVKGKLDGAKGQLVLVADTLGEYKKCEGLPEMASAIKRIVAALPTRADTPAMKQGLPGSSSDDRAASQYEKLSNDQLIAEAKGIAVQIKDYQTEWRYKVNVEVGARYQNQREQSNLPPGRIDQLWKEETKARESVNQQYATNSKVLFVHADDLRRVCVDRLKKTGGERPPDGDIEDVFKTLATAGEEDLGDRNAERVSSYLVDLCSRLRP